MAEPITSSGVEFAANGETGPGYLSRPQSNGWYPGIVLIQEWWGIDDHIKDVTNRFAGEGYAVLSPDLFHGEVTSEPSEAMKLIQGMDRDRATKELNGAVAYLKGQPFCNGKVGIIGTCSGGRHSYLVVCRISGFSAVVDCWGGGVIMPSDRLTPKQPVPPIEYTSDLSCPILGLFGNDDQNPSPEQVNQHEEELKKHGKTYEFHRYDGAGHGFWYYDRPAYRPEQAMDAWSKTFAFFGKYLA